MASMATLVLFIISMEEPYRVDLASAEVQIRHVFGDTPITEASIGAAPPDILVKLSGSTVLVDHFGWELCNRVF